MCTERDDETSKRESSDVIATVTSQDFREAMSRLATAVNIVTTNGPGGRAGFTASAVASVTDDPPTLLVCINKSANVYSAFAQNDYLCVNVLGSDHENVSNMFGGMATAEERFNHASWHVRQHDLPVLDDAQAHFECRITQRVEVGTHTVLFCEVIDMAFCEESHCLLYYGRQYHKIGTSKK